MKIFTQSINVISIVLSALLFFSTNSFAQNTSEIGCKAWEQHLKKYDTNAKYAKAFNQADLKAKKWLEKNDNFSLHKNGKIVIPVVVHIIYNNTNPTDSALQYIPEARVIEQIDILNQAFADNVDKSGRREIFDTLSADFQIEFKLACQDPSGNPTNGIIYVPTDVEGWDLLFSPGIQDSKRTSEGGSDAWDVTKYLNIWSANLTFLGSEGLYGIATFPSAMPESEGGDPEQVDEERGLLMHYAKFGVNTERTLANGDAYSLGYTLVHEAGHFFGLRHIWGDEQRGGFGANDPICSKDDFVFDTPNSSDQKSLEGECEETNECNIDQENAMSNGFWGTINPPDMVENYMHYTPEKCQSILTKGQKRRAWSFLYTSYPGLMSSSGACQPNDFQAATTGSAVTCNNICDGDLTIHARNAVEPLQFSIDGGSFQADSSFTDLCKGIHNISVKDANGAVLDFEAEVYSDYSNPIITATKTNTTCGSCTDGAIDLDIQYGAPNFNVSWSNGQTGVNLSNVAAGTYTATITDNCGNVFTETFDVSGVGISSKATIEANIYPNPASDLLFIETKSPIKTIKVRAINGRTVLNQVGNGSKATISLKNLAKGIYLVEVTSDLGRHVAKQIVE